MGELRLVWMRAMDEGSQQVASGRACSRREGSARCFIAAHDASRGREAWPFYTAAGADDPGGQAWGNVPELEAPTGSNMLVTFAVPE